MRRCLALALGFACAACSPPTDVRARVNSAAAEADLLDTLKVTVQGGSVVDTQARDGDRPHRVRIRAQSLDVRVDVSTSGCDPEPVVIEVSHLGDPTGLEITRRTFLDGVSSLVAAARAAAGGAVAFVGDANDPDRTPLELETAFAVDTEGVDPLGARLVTWTLVLDRGRNRVESRPGSADTTVAPTVGACAALDPVNAGPLANAPLVVRTRLRRPLSGDGYTFAVWGNNGGRSSVRKRLLASLAGEDLAFAVITGDLIASGNTSDLKDAVRALDAGLQIPWFTTVGERDVSGTAGTEYVDVVGRSTFAFDAGQARLIVLDSADSTLDDTVYDALPDWLDDKPLWWLDEPPPARRIVLTHVPPIEPSGTRQDAFKHRPEAARFIGALVRAGVDLLITGHLAIFDEQRVAPLTVVHSGGAGTPMESTSDAPLHWLRVHVAGDCLPPRDAACTVEKCEQCVQIELVPIP